MSLPVADKSADPVSRQMSRGALETSFTSHFMSEGRLSRQLTSKTTRSFLNPTGAQGATSTPPKALPPHGELVLFFLFVLIRAAHPAVIDASKTVDLQGKGYFAYSTGSATIVMSLCNLVFWSAITYSIYGAEVFMSIFQKRPLMLFSVTGIIYAMDDYLEMASLGHLSGAPYQILMQSKIVVTAVMMMYVKGVFQTRLQWTLLSILMLGMSVFMCQDKSGDSGEVPLMGMFFAALKVLCSCLGAVFSDKFMKDYKSESTTVQIVRTFLARSVVIVLLSFTTADLWNRPDGFFGGWDGMTYGVVISFMIKSVSSLYIVSLLDSLLKNIAECLAVLVMYIYEVVAPWVTTRDFEVTSFMSVLVIVAAILAYIDSKSIIENAKKYLELVGTQLI
jgi:drug/metabolite transporter (DMT)-like permease